LSDHIAGWRDTLIATDTPPGTGNSGGPTQYLETRHRAHARVEDRIRCGKSTGIGRFPSRQFTINGAWLALALTGIDLLAWTSWLLLDGDLAKAEPKKLRYRLLHVAARITHTGRRTHLRIDHRWPWRQPLVTAFDRLLQPATPHPDNHRHGGHRPTAGQTTTPEPTATTHRPQPRSMTAAAS
jgi:hypothetical protein